MSDYTLGAVLLEAKSLINGDRQQDYGTPDENFKRIAGLWSIYLDKDISPADVAMLMTLLKVARISSGRGTHDCYVDAAGYIGLGDWLAAGQNKKQAAGQSKNKPDYTPPAADCLKAYYAHLKEEDIAELKRTATKDGPVRSIDKDLYINVYFIERPYPATLEAFIHEAKEHRSTWVHFSATGPVWAKYEIYAKQAA